MSATHEVLTGICSVCLGRFVVEGKGPVLHGYKRPGDGYIRGNCDGMRFPMYEVSTEGCIWMRDGLREAAASHRECARKLRGGETKTIHKVHQKYMGSGEYKKTPYTLTKDSPKEHLRLFYAYTWEDLVESEAEEHDRSAKNLDRDADEFQKMIDAWKPGLEFISEDRLNAQKQEVRDAKANAARVKRNFKALKAAFFHIGAAISKHKKGWSHAEWEWEQMYIKHNSKASARYADIHRLAPFGEMYPKYAKKAKGAK
jgi:hypothetical protein